jgi:hypothetical protein
LIVPKHNCSKAKCSLLYGGDDIAPHTLVERFAGIAIMAWTCQECYPLFRAYGRVLRRMYPPTASGQLAAAWKTYLEDSQIGNLFYGTESSGVKPRAYAFRQGLRSVPAQKPLLGGGLEDLPEYPTLDHFMPPKKKNVKAVVVVAKGKQTPRSQAHKAKKAKSVTIIKGSGDYRPTSFNRVRGRGDYFSDFLGGAGHAVGGALTGLIGSGIRSLTGNGDYRSKGPKSNSLMQFMAQSIANNNMNKNAPSELPFSMGAASVQFAGRAPRISHREYVGDIIAPADPTKFHTTVYRIQPGISGEGSLFPWGSSVAGCFQQYIMHGAILEYVSTSSDYAATSALGDIMMSTVYDSSLSPLADVDAINNNEHTTTAKPSVPFYHPLECAGKDTPTMVKYIRKSNTASTDTDERLDDLGIFQVSTKGLAAAPGTILGQLWIMYDIELLKAALPDKRAGTSFGAQTYPGAFVSFSAPYDGMVVGPKVSLPVAITVNGPWQRIDMPIGYNGDFLMVLAGTAPPGTTYSGWSIGSEFYGTDITLLNYFPSRSAVSDAGSLWVSNANTMLYAVAFRTIAENVDNNYYQFQVGGALNIGSDDTIWSLFVVPLDNDAAPGSDAVSVLSKLLKGKEQLLETFLNQNAKPRSLPAVRTAAAGSGTTAGATASAAAAAAPPASARSESFELDMEEEKVDTRLDGSVHLPMSTYAKLIGKMSLAA